MARLLLRFNSLFSTQPRPIDHHLECPLARRTIFARGSWNSTGTNLLRRPPREQGILLRSTCAVHEWAPWPAYQRKSRPLNCQWSASQCVERQLRGLVRVKGIEPSYTQEALEVSAGQQRGRVKAARRKGQEEQAIRTQVISTSMNRVRLLVQCDALNVYRDAHDTAQFCRH